MKNEYRQYLIKVGLAFTIFSIFTFLSQEWRFLLFVVNALSLASFLFLDTVVEKPFGFFEAIVILPLLLFLTAVVFGFFGLVDDSFISFFLLLTILSPVFILIGGFLQPRKI